MADPVHPDALLLERIRADAPGAFEEFVERYADRIHRLGRRMCIDAENASDVLQETLISAYRSLKRLEHPEALRTWVYRVAGNACLMMQRKNRHADLREISLDELLPSGGKIELPDPAELPDAEAARREVARRIHTAIGDLPPHYRIVLILRDVEGLSTRETAEALGLEDSAVKMRLHRARLRVRQVLEEALS